ncbi:MAG: leucine-rich repeat protein [Oscillospiraceae bacterium]|nr:leucine-rich repeat protein [Oscillospiraceae bacterium]
MKLRLFSLPLAALTMAAALFLLCALPATADDDAAEAETVCTETEQIELDTSSLSDNDTLLEDYVEHLFSLNSGIALSSYGEDYLSGVDLDVYTQLKAAIESIAAGEESSSIVTVSLQYTPDELDAANYDSAYNAFYAQLNRTHVLNYLLYDCPYDFYWFDKTANTTSQFRHSETQELLTVTITYYFPVAEGYQGETKYTVNSEKAAAAVQSAANALAIVEAYDSLSDSEKLSAYKDEICALTSYSTDYATASYGDIWQLVWVFDGDEDTNVVCEDYSKAFQYLCDLSSFDDVLCYTVSGTMNGGTGAGNHMWNVVCLNGVTYMADITNSDSGTIGKNGGLFMVCADDAVSSSSSGYSFLVGSTTIRYTYSSTSLELYGADALTLGSAAGQSGSSTETGTCGENVIWTLDTSTGVLTISGEGEMDNYSYESGMPWVSSRESITSIIIGNGIISIGSYAFYGCKNVTEVVIPSNVKSIENYAFSNCTSLLSVTLSDGVTSIGQGAFGSCENLTSITIPDSVTSLGSFTFSNCSSLESATINGNISKINENAFSGCVSLTSITIPSSVVNIGGYAFYECGNLTDVYYGGSEAQWDAISIENENSNVCLMVASIHFSDGSIRTSNIGGSCGDNVTWVLKDGVITISGTGDMEDYECPWYAWKDDITSVVIENGVTSVGAYAFCECENVVNVSLPSGLKCICSYAFYRCAITSIEIPDSLAQIEESAFRLCVNLSEITLPDSIGELGYFAFSGCKSLTSIVIPSKVRDLADYLFDGCSNLTDVTLSDNLSGLGEGVFYNCSSLKSIALPDSISYISESAFYGCNSLTDVYYGGSEAEWNEIEIGNNNVYLISATIHYNSTSADDEPASPTTPGDLNGDGEVNASDLTILARHVGKVETIEDETCLANADVTGDGDVDASDLTKLAQYVGKIITSLE